MGGKYYNSNGRNKIPQGKRFAFTCPRSPKSQGRNETTQESHVNTKYLFMAKNRDYLKPGMDTFGGREVVFAFHKTLIGEIFIY